MGEELTEETTEELRALERLRLIDSVIYNLDKFTDASARRVAEDALAYMLGSVGYPVRVAKFSSGGTLSATEREHLPNPLPPAHFVTPNSQTPRPLRPVPEGSPE